MNGRVKSLLVSTRRGLFLVWRTFCVLVIAGFWLLLASPWHSSTSAHHGGAHMLLFWDGPTAPSGWSFFNDANGRYIRGDSVANFGGTGGTAQHTPGITSVVVNAQTGANRDSGSSSPQGSTYGHSHTASVTNITTADNLPAYCNLRLIRHNDGIPNIIPTGAIAIFDDSPGIPANWTDLTPRHNRMIRADTNVSTSCAGSDAGGADTHNHTVTWSALSTASQGADRSSLFNIENQQVAVVAHAHSAPSASVTDTLTSMPSYASVLIGKAGVDTPTISLGLTALFDEDPGGGWVIRSDPGGPFYQNLLRGSNAYDDSPLGDADGLQTHANLTSGPSGTNTGGFIETLTNLLPTLAPNGHTHTITATFQQENITPPYFNVVIAEKVNFILEFYRWYEDVGVFNVTDPWSSLNTPENTAIPTLPSQYNPPGDGYELRLRIQILIAGNNLAANEAEFKLQFKAGTDATCTTGSWTDVGPSEVWSYTNSTTFNDNEELTSTVFSTPSNVMGSYLRSGSAGTNHNPAVIGDRIEYDFHIRMNGAPGATKFSFRPVESNGTLLSLYADADFPDTPICPTLSTRPGTDQQMRHGNFFEDGVERGFFWVN